MPLVCLAVRTVYVRMVRLVSRPAQVFNSTALVFNSGPWFSIPSAGFQFWDSSFPFRNTGFQFQGPRFQFWDPSCQFQALVLNPGIPVLNSWPRPSLHVDNLHYESPAKVTPWHPVFASAEATRLSHAVARSRAPPLRKCTKSSLPARKLPAASSASECRATVHDRYTPSKIRRPKPHVLRRPKPHVLLRPGASAPVWVCAVVDDSQHPP